MKYSILTIVIVIFVSQVSLMAQYTIDSLKHEISQPQSDSTLTALYRSLLKELYYANEIEEMLAEANNMYVLFESRGYKEGMQSSLFYKGTALDILGKTEEAIHSFDKGVRMGYEVGDSLMVANQLFNKAALHQRQGEKDSALKSYLEAYKIYEQYNEKESISLVLNNIAVIYRNQNRYEKAIEMYNEALDIKTAAGDSLGMANTLLNLGLLYSYKEEMEKALTFLNQAKQLYKRLEADSDLADCENNLGVVFMNLGCYQEAGQAFKKANVFYQNHQRPWSHATNCYMLGSIAIVNEDYKLAEQYLIQSINISNQIGRWAYQLENFLKLSEAQYALGKNEGAYLSMKEAYRLQDSIKEEKKLALIVENQERFQVLQKEKALALSQLALEKSTRQRNNLIGGLLLLLFMGGGLVLIQRQRIVIAQKDAAIQQQRIQQLQQEKQLTALSAVVEGEEKERMRIAADLHDGLGGLLTSVKSHFTTLFEEPENNRLFQKTSYLIDEACTEVRRISRNMAPRALLMSGLQGALEDLAGMMQINGLECELEMMNIDEDKIGERSVAIYRIIQELCNNTMKHAEAKSLLIQLFVRDGWLSILVEDDGKGFDLKQEKRNNGMGLSSIDSRVEVLRGSIHWDSVIGEGTTVSVRVPMG